MILYDVNHGHWHFEFGMEVNQTDYTFQFNKYLSEKSYILRGRIVCGYSIVSISAWSLSRNSLTTIRTGALNQLKS